MLDSIVFIIRWVEWCAQSYTSSLFVCIIVAVAHYVLTNDNFSVPCLSLATMVGGCAWIVYCLYRQGYALG